MTLKATVLFGSPHDQLAALLIEHVAKCQGVEVVTGFATVDGVNRLFAF